MNTPFTQRTCTHTSINHKFGRRVISRVVKVIKMRVSKVRGPPGKKRTITHRKGVLKHGQVASPSHQQPKHITSWRKQVARNLTPRDRRKLAPSEFLRGNWK